MQASVIGKIYPMSRARGVNGYAEVLAISGNTTRFIKEMYGTDWSGFIYNKDLNGGYPIQKDLVTIGSVVGDNSTEVSNRLKELGFVAG